MSTFDIKQFDVVKFDAILGRGLSHGVGKRDGQMCIEAAICAVMDLPHDDDPGCVAVSVRRFKIALNDKAWSSPKARAEGLRDLGLAQLGSLGVVDDRQFVKLLAEDLIRVMLPTMVRDIWPKDEKLLAAALRCEQEGTKETARELERLLRAAYAAADAAAAAAADAAAAAYAAAYAADTAAARDKYLGLAAKIALDVLKTLKSPGCELL